VWRCRHYVDLRNRKLYYRLSTADVFSSPIPPVSDTKDDAMPKWLKQLGTAAAELIANLLYRGPR
jgi:hypothetical protein